MMPPADRIHKDPDQRPRKHPSNVADHDFQAVGSSLRILQLIVEGLSPAKRSIIQSLAEKHHVDVICLEETHVKEDKSNRFERWSVPASLCCYCLADQLWVLIAYARRRINLCCRANVSKCHES